MKHYRWKRFCCRLFLRRSPRNAAVFGFGWLLLAETLPAGHSCPNKLLKG